MDTEIHFSKLVCKGKGCLDLLPRDDESIFSNMHGLYRRIPKLFAKNWKDGKVHGNIISSSELLSEHHKGGFSVDWDLICSPEETLVRGKSLPRDEIIKKFGIIVISVEKFKKSRDNHNFPLRITYSPVLTPHSKNIAHSLIQPFSSKPFIKSVRDILFDEDNIADWVSDYDEIL